MHTIVTASLMTIPWIRSQAINLADFLPEVKIVVICIPTILIMSNDSAVSVLNKYYTRYQQIYLALLPFFTLRCNLDKANIDKTIQSEVRKEVCWWWSPKSKKMIENMAVYKSHLSYLKDWFSITYSSTTEPCLLILRVKTSPFIFWYIS